MSEAMKPTPGPWEADGGAVSSVAVSCIADCTFARVMPGWSGTDYATGVHMRDNARLIAEAGTVFHETQLSPRQLVEQRDELLAALIQAQMVINGMKVEAETAAQGDEQMMLEACETISNDGLQGDMEIRAAIAKCKVKP